jgi:hypothetical protein
MFRVLQIPSSLTLPPKRSIADLRHLERPIVVIAAFVPHHERTVGEYLLNLPHPILFRVAVLEHHLVADCEHGQSLTSEFTHAHTLIIAPARDLSSQKGGILSTGGQPLRRVSQRGCYLNNKPTLLLNVLPKVTRYSYNCSQVYTTYV